MTSKQQQIESLNSEIQILQKKLDSKTKAFAILINELETLRHEREQFKTLADSLQEKCVQFKKQLADKSDPLKTIQHSHPTVYEHPNDSTIHLLKTALKNVQDEKEILQSKFEELTHELNDVKGDLSIFRQKRHRARISNSQNENDDREINAHHDDETTLLKCLEQSNERIVQLDNDLKLVVCQKEELEIERDSFKTKYTKLNQELNKMLNGNDKQIVDIEIVLSENRYLKEKINELIQEKNIALANAKKYKEILQTQRSTNNTKGQSQSSGSVLTHKQVRSLINQSYLSPKTAETEHDLRSIAEALLENIKDKNVTIVHQRKTNKILANRVAELEKLLSECSLNTKSDQTNSLINLLDRTPPITNSDTSQFVNSTDDLQQTSPTQIFSFSSTSWPTSSLSAILSSDDDKHRTVKSNSTAIKNVIECHQSTKNRNKSESTDLEMDDPLQSPTLASSIAYLEEKDLIPPTSPNFDEHNLEKQELESLQNLLHAAVDKNINRQSTKLTDSNSSAANLTC